MFMRTGNSVVSEEVQRCDQEEEKRRSGHPREAGEREGHSTTVRTSGLRWGEPVSPNFALIPEVQLTGLTVHDGSLFFAVSC